MVPKFTYLSSHVCRKGQLGGPNPTWVVHEDFPGGPTFPPPCRSRPLRWPISPQDGFRCLKNKRPPHQLAQRLLPPPDPPKSMLWIPTPTALVHKTGVYSATGLHSDSAHSSTTLKSGAGGAPGGIDSLRAFIFQTPDSKVGFGRWRG